MDCGVGYIENFDPLDKGWNKWSSENQNFKIWAEVKLNHHFKAKLRDGESNGDGHKVQIWCLDPELKWPRKALVIQGQNWKCEIWAMIQISPLFLGKVQR